MQNTEKKLDRQIFPGSGQQISKIDKFDLRDDLGRKPLCLAEFKFVYMIIWLDITQTGIPMLKSLVFGQNGANLGPKLA